MRTAIVLAAVGAALLLFAAWGTQSAAGRRAFDEMAGMIPYGAGALGALLLVVAVAIALVRLLRD